MLNVLTGNPVHPRSIDCSDVVSDELQHITQNTIHQLSCHSAGKFTVNDQNIFTV